MNRSGFNESGANLLVNLGTMMAVSPKKTEVDQVSLFEEISDESGSHCLKRTR